MDAATFRNIVLQSAYLPTSFRHYLVGVADTLSPAARERLAKRIDFSGSKVLEAARKAANNLEKIAAIEAKEMKDSEGTKQVARDDQQKK